MWSIRDVRSMDEYVHELDPQGELFAQVDKTPIQRYNIAPGMFK